MDDDDPDTATRAFLRQFIHVRGNAKAACERLDIGKSHSRRTDLAARATMELIFGLCAAEGNIENLADAWGVSFSALLDTINKNARVERKLRHLRQKYADVRMLSDVFELPFRVLKRPCEGSTTCPAKVPSETTNESILR